MFFWSLTPDLRVWVCDASLHRRTPSQEVECRTGEENDANYVTAGTNCIEVCGNGLQQEGAACGQAGRAVLPSVALFGPGVPEFDERTGFEEFFGQGKDDAFLLVEMFARGDYGGHHAGAGLPEVAGCPRAFEVFVDLFMLLVKRIALADLFQAMVQRFDQEFLLHVRVGFQQRFCQTC